jgi:hypothetical protein
MSNNTPPQIIQIVEIKGYEPRYTIVAFNAKGKNACKKYYDTLFALLKKEMYVYFKDCNYRNTEPFTYNEIFYKIANNVLIKTEKFEDCDFLERIFYTANHDSEDQGIVPFVTYSILNSGKPFHLLLLF